MAPFKSSPLRKQACPFSSRFVAKPRIGSIGYRDLADPRFHRPSIHPWFGREECRKEREGRGARGVRESETKWRAKQREERRGETKRGRTRQLYRPTSLIQRPSYGASR